MLRKALFFGGKEVVAVPGDCRGRPCQDVFHGHAHAVDDGSVHQDRSALQRKARLLSCFRQGMGILVIHGGGALAVHLHKINALPPKDPVPGPVKSACLFRIRHQTAGRIFINTLSRFQGCQTSGGRSVPVASQGVPDTEPGDGRILFDIPDHGKEALRKFYTVGSEVREHLFPGPEPAVVDKDPAEGDLLFRDLLCFQTNLFFADLRIEGVPAAPSQVFQHLRDPSLLPEAKPSLMGKLCKDLMDRLMGRAGTAHQKESFPEGCKASHPGCHL